MGGQKSLRSYWRNYFESTDGLIWVVDGTDGRRMEDCRLELHSLLKEEVKIGNNAKELNHFYSFFLFFEMQRLAGATLLVFANKQDVEGAMTADQIKTVSRLNTFLICKYLFLVIDFNLRSDFFLFSFSLFHSLQILFCLFLFHFQISENRSNQISNSFQSFKLSNKLKLINFYFFLLIDQSFKN